MYAPEVLGINHQSPLIYLDPLVFPEKQRKTRGSSLENHELLRRSTLLPRLRVIKTEPRCPLPIRQCQHPNLPTLRQMSLNRSQRRMILSTGRPILHVHAELHHAEAPIQEIMPEPRCLAPLLLRLDREIEHHQAPHSVIRHAYSPTLTREGPCHDNTLRRSTSPSTYRPKD